MEKINIDFSKMDNVSKSMIANAVKAAGIINRLSEIVNDAVKELNKTKRPKYFNAQQYRSIR
jgi:transcriptional regulatory protein LevR